jgi:glycosyltransferase involved in cell wall biosynthesis
VLTMTGAQRGEARRVQVMHVSQPVDGGAATVIEHLAAADIERGRKVTLVSPPGRLQRWAVDHDVPWINLRLTRNPSIFDVKAIYRLRRLLPGTDVVYLHSSKAGAVGRLALASLTRSRRPKCAFCPHAWSWYVGGRSAMWFRRFERMAARWADVIVVVSRGELRDGRTQLTTLGAQKLRLIENGVDTDVFSPMGPVAVRGSEALIVCVGRLCEQKGQDILIPALGLLDERSVRLSLVGEGPAEPGLHDLASRAGVANRVHFAGHVDPRPYYRAADLVVIPSRWEGLPLVLLEAMACGAAVLASLEATDGFRGDSGVITRDIAEPTELAKCLVELLSDPRLRLSLGKQARVAVENYSLRRATEQYNSLIESVVPSPGLSLAGATPRSKNSERQRAATGDQNRPSRLALTPQTDHLRAGDQAGVLDG